jgi:hypothetical protein
VGAKKNVLNENFDSLRSADYELLNPIKGIYRSRNNKHNAQNLQQCFILYAGSYMFRHQSAIFRELLDPSELGENTDRYGGLSHHVG